VRYIELELEETRPLEGVEPPLANVCAVACPDDRFVVLCDRPDGATPRLTRWSRGGPHELTLLDAPGFIPRILVDSEDAGRVLAVGRGENSGVLFDIIEGRVASRFNLGEGVVDATYDNEGNIVVLRAAPPLLDRYGPEGDLVERDRQIQRICEQTRVTEGTMLLIQRDGSVWLNLCEKFNADGELVGAIDPADVFGTGHVTADLIGWDGIVVLNEAGKLYVVERAGTRRAARLPAPDIERALGRPLTARLDLIVTRDEMLCVLATDVPRLLRFRILSE